MKTRGFSIAAAIVFGSLATQAAAQGRAGPFVAARAGFDAAYDDYSRTVGEGAMVGGLAGAAAGALAGLSNNRGDVAEGALIGGMLGLVGGLIDGFATAEAKKQAKQTERGLDAAIRTARQRNEKLSRLVGSADRLVAVRRDELTQLQQSGSAAERAELRRALDGDVNEMGAAIEKARAARDEARAFLQNYRDSRGAGGLPQAVSQNDAAYRRLASDRDRLAAMRDTL